MSERALHPLAEDYLARLRKAGHHLPSERLHELLSEVEEHLAEAAPAGAQEHDVLNALERLGPVSDIVEAEQPAVAPPADRRGLREWAAVILLPLGGFVFGVGWLVGLILLWSSRLWTTRDKLIGTLIVPGGLAVVPFVLFSVATTSSGACGGPASVRPTIATVVGPGSSHTQATAVSPRASGVVGNGGLHCTAAGGTNTITTVLQIALLVIVILGPIASAIYLARRARRSPEPLATAGY